MGSNEIRRTSNNIVESQSDKTGQAESQANGGKSWNEKLRKHVGPGFAGRFVVTGLGVLAAFQGIVGAEGSTPEAHSTALTQRGSDNAIGLPPAFPTEQRAKIIGKSPTEPYVSAPRPEWLAPYQGPTIQQLWPSLYDQMVKGSGEKGQASKNSLRGEAQEIHDEETSSEQAKPDKHKASKHLSLRKQKIATRRALRYETKRNLEVRQIFKKRLNDKKVRERSLLESNPERRQLYDPLSYNYTRLTPTDAQAQLQYSQAFREATQYLGKQPDWNNSYAYQSSATEKGIVAMYPSEEYSTTFLAIDNPSAGNDTIGLLGQFVVQSNESTFITWSTPQGKPFAAQLQQWQHGPNEGWIGANEALVSGDINWGNSTCSPTYFANNDGGGENTPFFFGCLDCVMSLSNQSSCSDDCILPNGAFGIYTAKQCLATNSKDQYACLSVSLSGGDLAVQPLPYMIKISGELYLQNNCSETAQMGSVTVNFNYVCPPRTCPPGRAYYALEKPSNSSNYQLNPGKRELFSNFETWVYCSSFNETEKVNYISLPTTIDVNIMAGGEVTVGIEPLGAYSPNLNFHVYDASMYPDLHPYPALPSACGENDPNCTQLCARHPEANIPSDTIPAQYPEIRPPSPPETPASPPEAPAHRHKGLSNVVIAGIAAVGGIGGGVALTVAAWRCCCKRKFEGVRPDDRDKPMPPISREPGSSSGVHPLVQNPRMPGSSSGVHPLVQNPRMPGSSSGVHPLVQNPPHATGKDGVPLGMIPE